MTDNRMREESETISTTSTAVENEGRKVSYEDELLKNINQQLPQQATNKAAESLTITSAFPLTNEDKAKIVNKYLEKTGTRLRQIKTVVDQKLISGIRLQSESFYYEVSGQKTLRELKDYLSRNPIIEEEL
ncbi:F0F1 ATP synthase subunit delta [Fundicoccus sp. Sow4_H7]|uniref:F0F1 ATP synthase subunit delta n=1 Tax=Fundicoccus sp. Sow4_H7 TaxID=3438784 RepID=UPI003F8E80AD